MLEVKFLNYKELENEWKLLEKNQCAPYQIYDFVGTVPLVTSPKDILRKIGAENLNAVLYKNSVCKMIIPLCVFRKGLNSCEVHLVGYDFGAGLLDILYAEDIEYEDFKFCMDECLSCLKNKFKYCTFLYGRIQDERLSKWLDWYLSGREYTKKGQKCAAIPLSGDYDEWYNSLDKKMRQNIRTMYNRMKKDSVELKCEFYDCDLIESKKYKEVQKLYAKRVLEKKNIKFPGISFLVYLIKKENGFVKALNNEINSFHSLVWINGTLVAFLSGVTDKKCGRVIIPHLSYNSDFKRYSPGILLVCETIKYITSKRQFKMLDLSCGSEEYKYTLGGQEYNLQEYAFIL